MRMSIVSSVMVFNTFGQSVNDPGSEPRLCVIEPGSS